MNRPRALVPRRPAQHALRRVLFALLAVIVLLRALIPAGFMPAGGVDGGLAFCDGEGPLAWDAAARRLSPMHMVGHGGLRMTGAPVPASGADHASSAAAAADESADAAVAEFGDESADEGANAGANAGADAGADILVAAAASAGRDLTRGQPHDASAAQHRMHEHAMTIVQNDQAVLRGDGPQARASHVAHGQHADGDEGGHGHHSEAGDVHAPCGFASLLLTTALLIVVLLAAARSRFFLTFPQPIPLHLRRWAFQPVGSRAPPRAPLPAMGLAC
ncbi:hypothetical protein [Chitinasiproducens palmae]|uniref:Uncharacterized protein n=1 Tax=Chitinasiproducens palmae TaxID=1770053 RepID=A0A1H2PW45_9BURK|nr:hypothetical protein [Chitinasiproducens palmae]SDV51198.1 hypothetical protein SAMN05216551_115108 [Chitinasiproducens palmae]